MHESIPCDQKCKSSKELLKIKSSVDTIFNGVERCKQTIAKTTYYGHIDPFIQNTIEGNFSPQIRAILPNFENFHLCLKEEMTDDLRYFNSLEHEVDSLKSQLETQKTQFLNEIDRLSREYYYVDHMNAILGVYTKLDEVTNLQCNYLEALEKCQSLENELSKRNTTSKSFEALQQHVINLELALQQCQEQIENNKAWKQKESTSFQELNVKYFEIQDLKAQLQDKVKERSSGQVLKSGGQVKWSRDQVNLEWCPRAARGFSGTGSLPSDRVDLTGDEDGDNGMGDPTGGLMSLGGEIGDSLLVALYACMTFIYESSWKGEMASEAKRSLDKSSEGSEEVFPVVVVIVGGVPFIIKLAFVIVGSLHRTML
ncbi:hypothetical protein Tco_0527047 [Tanacetum coccineum]